MKKTTTYANINFIYLLILFFALSVPYRFYGLNIPAISSFCIIEPILGVGVIYLIFKILISRRLRIGPRLLFYILLFPLILSIISLGWSSERAFTINEILVNIEALAAYLVVLNFGLHADKRELLRVLLFFSISLLLVSLLSYPPLSIFHVQLPGEQLMNDGAKAAFLLSYNARLSHPFIGLSNNFATILAMLFPVIFYIGKGLSSKLWLFVASLLLGAIIATLSRGVSLATAASFGLVFLYKIISTFALSKNSVKYIGLISITSVILVLFVYFTIPEMANHLQDRFNSGGASARFGLAVEAFKSISKHPFLGYGGGVPFSSHFTGGLTDIHNAYLQRIYWYGIPLGFISSLSIISIPLFLNCIPCHDSFCQHVKEGMFIAMLGQIFLGLIESSWEGSVLRVIIYALLGLFVALSSS